MDTLPIGRREGLRLEFKGRDALKDPAKIAREVVGMLNEKGGDVWVGISERESVAEGIERIDDVSRARTDLLNHLIDTIEPSPLSGEVQVREFPVEGGGAVLLVKVEPAGRQPYAQLRQSSRLYVRRIDDRLRPMTREEVRDAFGALKKGKDLLARALSAVNAERQKALGEKKSELWMCIKPAVDIGIDISSKDVKAELEAYVRDPALSGNRRFGWSFASDIAVKESRQGRLWFKEPNLTLEYRQDGCIRFQISLDHIYNQGPPKQLWPLALLEYPTSVLRLAKHVYGKYGSKLQPDSPIVADLALLSAKGWSLRPGTPDYFGEARLFEDADDLLLIEPVIVGWAEVEEKPDLVAWRLIRKVYEEFGFSEDNIPKHFRRQTGELVFPP